MKNKTAKYLCRITAGLMILTSVAGGCTSPDTGAETTLQPDTVSENTEPSATAADTSFPETIDIVRNSYPYNGEEIMLLSGIKMCTYKEGTGYAMKDLNGDEISELMIYNGDPKSGPIAVYSYDSTTDAAKRLCIYDKNGYIEEPSSDHKTYIDELLAASDDLLWIDETQWPDGSLIGVADQTGDPGIATDYYISSNYDWLKEEHVKTQGDTFNQIGSDRDPRVEAQKNEMFDDREKYQGEDIQRLRDYYDIAVNWEKRDSEGLTPLKKYLDYIERINSLSDMTSYLSDPEKDPFCNFLSFSFTLNEKDATEWTVDIAEDSFSVQPRVFHNFEQEFIDSDRESFNDVVRFILEGSGYDKDDIDRILAESAEIEDILLENAWPAEEEKEDELEGYIPYDTLTSAFENFPLKKILNAYNISGGKIRAYFPDYIRALDSLYTTENLQKLKSYLLAHTAFASYDHLDTETSAFIYGADPDDEYREELAARYKGDLLSNRGEMPVAEENAYMTYFVDPDVKADITKMAEDIFTVYRTMLSEADWLSDEGRKLALEKLDSMDFMIMSPDELIDSSYLKLDPDMNYLDAYAKIKVSTIKHNGSFVGQKRKKNEWRYDLRPDVATTISNAYYLGCFNQFYVFAAFIQDETYRADMPREEKLAKLGDVIGHELTHGFDPNGIAYDKDGNKVSDDEHPNGWLPESDYEAFMKKADKLADYFNNIIPVPYDRCAGNVMWGEASADMGGMAISLKIAESVDDFDYDLYFRSYAELWRKQSTIIVDMHDIYDVHPLMHLRINVTCQQFDEFFETYGIKEGDLMYKSPEERIKIW